MTTLEQELAYNHEQYPGFLEHFLGMMDQGRIDGEAYEDGEGSNTCFYGHLGLWKKSDGFTEAHQTRAALTGDELVYLPIEILINMVEPEETPEDNEELALLRDAITQFLTTVPA